LIPVCFFADRWEDYRGIRELELSVAGGVSNGSGVEGFDLPGEPTAEAASPPGKSVASKLSSEQR
jgi:hypothetical protein